MRGRVLVSELHRVWTIQRLPLVIKGSCRRRRLRGSERHGFAERPPAEVRQNVHLLIPSVTASPCHRLAAARSRRGSDSLPGCHSTPRRRFATLVTKGRLWCIPFRIGAPISVMLYRAGRASPAPTQNYSFFIFRRSSFMKRQTGGVNPSCLRITYIPRRGGRTAPRPRR